MYLCIPLLYLYISLGSLHGVRLDPISCCQAAQAAQMVGHLTPFGITVSDRHVYFCSILLEFVFVILMYLWEV